MRLVALLVNLVTLCVLGVGVHGERWKHSMVVGAEDDFHIKWSVDAQLETIEFNVCAKTQGWLALGFSSNGAMAGSDIALAWVDSSGRAHLQDRHAEDEDVPVMDSSQDYLLLGGLENGTHTCVTFQRALVTCDSQDDFRIGHDVTKLLWAYHSDDPVGSSALIAKHDHHHRGHRSVHLLGHKFSHEANRAAAARRSGVSHLARWHITSDNLTLPNDADTTYWCKIVAPPIDGKAHVVRIEPIIEPASNAPFVHHMVLYRCMHPEPETMRQYLEHRGTNCFDMANMPYDYLHCQSIYMVWATGGDAFDLPPNVGMPLAEDYETTFFLFEIHYDNPELKQNVRDSSGLRLFYTRELRQYDADTATMGSVVDYRLIIPNAFNNFTVAGHCSPECFHQKMPITGLNVIAALPHGHRHMKKILVRHFRGSTELQPLAEENNYDFNFQDFQRFEEKRVVARGDQITVECTYDTHALKKPLFGGLSTSEEMCMVFLVYYPRMKNVRTCLSGLTPQTVMKLASVTKVTSVDDNDMNPVIVLPEMAASERLSSYVLQRDEAGWAQSLSNMSIDQLTHLVRYEPQKSQCFWRKLEEVADMVEIDKLIGYPTQLTEYRPPQVSCQMLTSTGRLLKHTSAASETVCFNVYMLLPCVWILLVLL